MYRLVTLAALRQGVDLEDAPTLGKLAASLDFEVGGRVLLEGDDVTAAIRSPEVSTAVSAVARHAPVRSELVERQRAWVEERGGAVVEGRDIGTVVFPQAEVKVYLTASPDARSRRRAGEIGATGAAQLDAVSDGIARRDHIDSSRDVSPLYAAEDATVIDSTSLGLEEVVDSVLALL
jgi:cytidylate kinase